MQPGRHHPFPCIPSVRTPPFGFALPLGNSARLPGSDRQPSPRDPGLTPHTGFAWVDPRTEVFRARKHELPPLWAPHGAFPCQATPFGSGAEAFALRSPLTGPKLSSRGIVTIAAVSPLSIPLSPSFHRGRNGLKRVSRNEGADAFSRSCGDGRHARGGDGAREAGLRGVSSRRPHHR